jgi:hypothetical protein
VSNPLAALDHREKRNADPGAFREIFLGPPLSSLGSELSNPLA